MSASETPAAALGGAATPASAATEGPRSPAIAAVDGPASAAVEGEGYALLRAASGTPAPAAGILSRTLAKAGGVRVTRFAFAAGEELSEHTSTRPALLHFLRGRARLVLGEDTLEVGPGDHLHMRAGLRHAVTALEPLEFVLTLLPGGAEG